MFLMFSIRKTKQKIILVYVGFILYKVLLGKIVKDKGKKFMYWISFTVELYSNINVCACFVNNYPSRIFFSKRMTFLSFLSLNIMRYGHILSQGLRPLKKLKRLRFLFHRLLFLFMYLNSCSSTCVFWSSMYKMLA